MCCLMGLSMNSGTHAQSAFAVDSPWMFGDWNGARTELQAKGYSFNLSYTGEMASVLDAKVTIVMALNMPISLCSEVILI